MLSSEKWRKVALSGQSSAKLHKIIFLLVVFVFYCFFNKDLAIYISPVILYLIEVAFGGGLLLFNIQS